jgi:iron complex transport system substrate-binding protein
MSILVALLVLLAACGGAPAAPAPTAAPAATAPEATSAPTAAAAETRTITDARGEQVVVPAAPQRVVALTEHDLDSALALGITPVGSVNGRGQTWLPAYLGERITGIESVGALAEPSLEKVAALDPDLILAGNLIPQIEALLPELGQIAPVVKTYSAGEGWKTAFAGTAAALNRTAEAEAFLAAYAERVAAIRATLPADGANEASVVRWMADGPVLMMPSIFSSLVLADLGLSRPAAQAALAGSHGAHSDPVSLEQLELIDGDWIFIGALNAEGSAALEAARANPLFQQLDAVQAGHVAVVDGAVWTSIGGPLAALLVLDDVEAVLAGAPAARAEATGVAADDPAALQVLEETGEYRLVKHGLGEAQVPLQPQRIVTLQDQNMLLPLLELGMGNVVGSVGSTQENGQQIFRRTLDYDTSQVQFVGEYGAPNLEAIAALQPDLILGDQFEITAENYDLYRQIAPTVVIEQFTRPVWAVMDDLALLTGRQAAAAELKARYDARIAEVRAQFADPSSITLSIITPYNATYYFDASAYDTGVVVARDLGFQLPPLHEQAIAQGDYPTYSMELLPQADGDLLFILDYNTEGPSAEYNVENIRGSQLFATLNAVRKGQAFVIDPSRIGGVSYGGLLGMVEAIEETIGGKNLDTAWEPTP